MASRHNEFSRLLGTVENDPKPLVGIPMADVPDLTAMADSIEADAQYHADNMKSHADRIRQLGDIQPTFGSSEL